MMEVASIAIYGFLTKPSIWTEIIIAHQRKGKAMDDLISRKQAINALSTITMYKGSIPFDTAVMRIEQLPSAQPEIIRCRECKFASGDSRICMKFDHSPIDELDFCSFAERREVTT